MDVYSLSDLVEVTGAKRRSVQLWAERGVIRALKSTESVGTGVHRQFSRDEAIIACIVHPFALRQISIGELVNVAAAVRTCLIASRAIIEAAIRGGSETTLSYESYFQKGELRHQASIGPGNEIHFANREKMGALCMAIRLETYLSKLQ